MTLVTSAFIMLAAGKSSPLHLYSYSLKKWFGQCSNLNSYVIVSGKKARCAYASSPFRWQCDTWQSVQFLPAGESALNLAWQWAFHRREVTLREIKHRYKIGQIETMAFRENVGRLWDRLAHTKMWKMYLFSSARLYSVAWCRAGETRSHNIQNSEVKKNKSHRYNKDFEI